MTRMVAISVRGQKIGEFHHAAKISDHDVELIRQLHEVYNLSYTEIAEKYEGAISHWMVGKICRYERRNKYPDNWIRV